MSDTRAPAGGAGVFAWERGCPEARGFRARMLARRLAIALMVASFAGCGGSRSENAGKEEAVPSRSIEEVLAAHADELLTRPGVTIVYQGALEDGAPCITVGVVDARAPSARELPDSLEGYPVVLQETGEVGPR